MINIEAPIVIIRKRLFADEVGQPGRRYNPECDCIETSPDGGTTWNEDPAADPRTNPAYLLPARTGGDPRCDAAEAMMQHFKAQVDAFLAGSSVWTIVSVFIPLLFFIPGVNIFIPLLFEIVSGLFAIGTEVVDAAMTEAVYDQMKCIFYCHIDADGQMSAAQLAAVQTDIDAQIGGTPNLVFDLFAGLWSEIVFSNAGAVGEYSGDCDECGCAYCYRWDFTLDDGGYVPIVISSLDFAVYAPGIGWGARVQEDACSQHAYAYFKKALGFTVDNATAVTITANEADGSYDAFNIQFYLAGVQQEVVFLGNGFAVDHAGTIPPCTFDEIQVFTNKCGRPAGITWVALTIEGSGVNPFGEDNC